MITTRSRNAQDRTGWRTSLQDAWWGRAPVGPITAAFLLSLSWLYRLGTALHKAAGQRAAARDHAQAQRRVPIIVVGNWVVGGAGKTPSTLAVLEHLKAKGWRPGVVSRGYGRSADDCRWVDPACSKVQQVGDEPLLIARRARVPVVVGRDRQRAVRELLAREPQVDVVVSDDGLQHATLARDIELVVQDARGIGNGWLIPAGPLRDPPSRLRTIDALITRVTQSDRGPARSGLAPRELEATMTISGFKQLATGKLLSTSDFVAHCADQPVCAYAGIGAPERFFADLRTVGLRLSRSTALPDHYNFNSTTLHAPESDVVVITAKDAVKCASLSDEKIWVAQVRSTFSDAGFVTWLDDRLRQIQTALH